LGQRVRLARRRYWFELWIRQSHSIHSLCRQSGYSYSTLSRIKNYWLDQQPEEKWNYHQVLYLIYDATYFHKEGCLLNLMDGLSRQIIAHRWVRKESYSEAYQWFNDLYKQGLEPSYVTTDGEQSIMRAMRLVWPEAKLQRCLYHLQHEGMRWLRSKPRTEAGRQLRQLLRGLCHIKTIAQRDSFISSYVDWLVRWSDYIKSLPKSVIAYKDLQRTVVLIGNALPDMFYYLEDSKVCSTTNALEAFHSRLKSDYLRHRGLTKEHRISYLNWYCYFKNIQFSNTK
jgi:hypothetical protein